MRFGACRILPLALAALSIGLTLPASAQTMRDAKICDNVNSPAADIIRTCSMFLSATRFNGKRIPNNIRSNTHFRRGIAYMRIYDFDKAIEDYTAALDNTSMPADILSARGSAYAGVGRDDLALADFDASLRVNRKHAPSLQARGLFYIRRGDYVRALADLDQSIAANPKLSWSYAHRSTIHYLNGDRARGEADLQKAIQVEPGLRASFEEHVSFTRNWVQYLKEIQDDRDYANWTRPPFDVYTSPH